MAKRASYILFSCPSLPSNISPISPGLSEAIMLIQFLLPHRLEIRRLAWNPYEYPAVDMIAWRRTWTRPVFGPKKRWDRFRFSSSLREVATRSNESTRQSGSQVACSCHFSYWTSHHVIFHLPMYGKWLGVTMSTSDDEMMVDLCWFCKMCVFEGYPAWCNILFHEMYKYDYAYSNWELQSNIQYKSMNQCYIKIIKSEISNQEIILASLYSTVCMFFFLFVSVILVVLSTGSVCHHFLKAAEFLLWIPWDIW